MRLKMSYYLKLFFMKRKQFLALILIVAGVFTLLFYRNSIGINLTIFEWILIPVMLFVNKPDKLNFLSKSILVTLIISSIMVAVINTPWTIFINFVLLFSFSTLLAFKGFRSYIHAFGESFMRVFTTHFSSQNYSDNNKNDIKLTNIFIKILLYGIVPLAIVLIFLLMYLNASSKFASIVDPFLNYIGRMFENLNITIVLIFILGVIVANILLRNSNPVGLWDMDISSKDDLERKRIKHFLTFKNTGLKTQNIMGIITLSALNVLILIFNITDIQSVWFFEWGGDFLKEFVHEGTWILIFAILCSSLIALFFFKDNLNFYSKNKLIKSLSITWIAQNIVMAISVIIRNYWYMTYFGLAYKRIAVLFFLVLAIIGLITVIIKITNKKTAFYLLKTNSFAAIILIAFSSFVDWNVVIAKYNFNNYKKSFVEYRFMATLEDSSLPYTIKTKEELKTIDSLQNKALPTITRYSYFWDSEKYFEMIELKKSDFLERYLAQKPLEWNLSDYITYKKLKNK